MSLKNEHEFVEVVRPRYLKANKLGKQKILDEFTSATGYHRKHAIRVLRGRRYFGKQVLVAMDGKVMRGTLNEKQEGVYLLAAYLPGEGIVLMEVAIQGKGQEIEAAPQVLKSIDLLEKVVMADATSSGFCGVTRVST